MGNLAGWNPNNKLPIYIDKDKVDTDLNDFPIRVHLSADSGGNNKNLSYVFDELGLNSKKIAVTESDGITQCYIEIENWDETNENANLWFKAPTVSSGIDSVFYLYYDVTQSGNTAYVGDTGEFTAQQVWDNNFVAVYHMSQDPSVGADAIKDSTVSGKHGTASLMDASNLVDGPIGKAIESDRVTNECISMDNALTYASSDLYTIEAMVEPGAGIGFDPIVTLGESSTTAQVAFSTVGSDKLSMQTFGSNDVTSDLAVPTLQDSYIAVTHKAAGHTDTSYDFFLNVTKSTTVVKGGSSDPYPLAAGTKTHYAYTNNDYRWGGAIDEVRISDIVRSDPWLNTTHYSNMDTLLSFDPYFVNLFFSSPTPIGGIKRYGLSQNLSIVVTVSGIDPNYSYDTSFYTGAGLPIGTTISGTPSGQPVNIEFPTLSGAPYDWYASATSSGTSSTSSTYDFYVRYLCSGICTVNQIAASGINVRLYDRSSGDLIGNTTTAGTGIFSIDSASTDEHYAIALNDDVLFNALIYDKIKPE